MQKLSILFFVTPMLALACSDAGDAAPGLGPNFKVSANPTTISAPVFGLAANPDGSMLAAESFVGVTELRKGTTSTLVNVFGVAGIAPIGRGNLLAVTSGLDPTQPDAQKLFRISRGNMHEIADLDEFEQTVNPDQVWNPADPESNPFNMVRLDDDNTLVADAAANAILIVSDEGEIDWVAVLTPHLVPTAPLKAFLGCPNPDIELCGLPEQIPAQPVATSIAVGPDGHYYAGELTGFPGTPGMSRIWRIRQGSLNVLCPSEDCTMVADGLTSVMDLTFGPDGLLYVAEFDEAGWFAVELAAGEGPLAPVGGGVVKTCDLSGGACQAYVSGLSLLGAIAAREDGSIWIAQNGAIPGTADIGPIQ